MINPQVIQELDKIITTKQNELRKLEGVRRLVQTLGAGEGTPQTRRTLSVRARRRIAAAQRARWARHRASNKITSIRKAA